MKRHCPNCQNKTIRRVIDVDVKIKTVEYFAKVESGQVDHRFYRNHVVVTSYSKCAGCNTPTLTIDEYVPDLDEDLMVKFMSVVQTYGAHSELQPINTIVYPMNVDLIPPDWLKDLPEFSMLLAFQVYRAFNAGMYTLCSMGIRALIDAYGTSLVGDDGGFNGKLNRLQNGNYISVKERELLEVVVEVGHASAHRAHEPSKEDILECLRIVNHVFEFSNLQKVAADVRNRTPSRKH